MFVEFRLRGGQRLVWSQVQSRSSGNKHPRMCFRAHIQRTAATPVGRVLFLDKLDLKSALHRSMSEWVLVGVVAYLKLAAVGLRNSGRKSLRAYFDSRKRNSHLGRQQKIGPQDPAPGWDRNSVVIRIYHKRSPSH